MKKVKTCPWCNEQPRVYQTIITSNWSHAFDGIRIMKERPWYFIECNNLKCSIRPSISKIEVNPLKFWNTRKGN